MTLNPSIVRFNPQPVGSVSSPETVLLLNSGSGQLKVSSIALLAGSDYVLTLPSPTPPSILNALVPYNIQVAFEPTTTGTRPGQILVYDNAPGSPHIVTLTGTGTAAQPSMGTINVYATLNGIALPAGYSYGYTLTGPASYSGGGAYSFSATPGSYTVAFNGYPGNLTLSNVTPSTTQSVAAGGSTTYTLNFVALDDFIGPTFMTPPGGGVTPQIVPAGSSAMYYVGLANPPAGSAASPITLSVIGTPNRSTPVFSSQPMYSGQSGTLSVGTDAASTLPGVYAISLSGTNANGLTHAGNTSSLVVTAPPASPVQLVSESSASIQGNAASSIAPGAVSADGRYVVFASSSTNLLSTGAGTAPGIFLRDLTAGTTTLASVSNGGVAAVGSSAGGKISANGRYVVFSSFADNLASGVLAGNQAIFVRDLQLGTTEREDVASNGTPGNGNSYGAVISPDGRFVAFLSGATNLTTGGSGLQAYQRDRTAGTTSLVSVGTNGSSANSNASGLTMSADGRFVAFDSSATNLVPQITNGVKQAFVRDLVGGTTTLVSSSPTGTAANSQVDDEGSGTYGPLAMSADGRFIVFNSAATNLVPQTLGSIQHLFLRDTQLGQTSLIDADSVGTPLGGWSAFSYPSISADGRFVSFVGFLQTLIRDTVAGQTAVVSLASSGAAGNEVSSSPESAVSPSGATIAFDSLSSNLVANDNNDASDAFIAHNPFTGSSSVQTLALASSPVSGGVVATGTITLSGPAPAGGANVAVWSNNVAAQTPPIVTIPAGVTTASFSIATSLVSTETIMTILASYNGGTGVAVLTLEPSAELTVSPPAWDFGYQPIATASAAEDFALTNSGTAALSLNSVQSSSGQVFNIGTNTCGSSIMPGGSCSISVSFKPSASGSTSGSLQISYGSPATIQSISVTGNGATPTASVAPLMLSFTSPGGPVATATLTNSGNAPLSNISASISGPNAGDFAISSDGCSGATLPPNSSCRVTVAFSPKATGTRLATLAIADSATGSPQTVGLSGIVVQATPTVVWSPSPTLTYGTSLGLGVLDAAANVNATTVAGGFAYTATVNGGTPQAVTATTVLGVGAYTLTATFTPTDTIDYTTATATASITVNQVPTAPLRFVPVTPCRIVDTRNPNGPFGGPELGGGSTRNFFVSNSSCGIPSTALAYSLNVTVVRDARLSYLTIWPAGQTQPLVSTLNSDGRVKANAAIVPAGSSGGVAVYATDSTQVVLDIDGYFVSGNSSALDFYPVTPCRVADTRLANGLLGQPYLSGGVTRSFPILSSSCNIPSSAQAYSLNFTAIPHSQLWYLSTWPTGQTQPVVSTLNSSGAITANAAIVPAGTGGAVNVYATNDSDLVIDVNGYFAPQGAGGLSLYNVTRLPDSRYPPFQWTVQEL